MNNADITGIEVSATILYVCVSVQARLGSSVRACMCACMWLCECMCFVLPFACMHFTIWPQFMRFLQNRTVSIFQHGLNKNVTTALNGSLYN